MDGTAMSEHPAYMTETRRHREGRYRRSIARATVAAVIMHALLIPTVTRIRRTYPLVQHSGYRGGIRLLNEISVLRDEAEVESPVETWAGELAEASFEIVNLELAEAEERQDTPRKTVVEEMDVTIGSQDRNRLESSLPQPTGQEIVIEHLVEPVYPQSAIDAGIEGVAAFGIQVAATGEVVRAWLVDSEVSGDCNIEAQRAILQWRFAPYLVNGRPAPFIKYYRIRFHFRDELKDARPDGLPARRSTRP
jgi:TonB family protein